MRRALAVFASMAVADALWTAYISAASQHQALGAAAWSGLIVLLGGWLTVSYQRNAWYVVPAALGGFVGTYLTIWWAR